MMLRSAGHLYVDAVEIPTKPPPQLTQHPPSSRLITAPYSLHPHPLGQLVVEARLDSAGLVFRQSKGVGIPWAKSKPTRPFTLLPQAVRRRGLAKHASPPRSRLAMHRQPGDAERGQRWGCAVALSGCNRPHPNPLPRAGEGACSTTSRLAGLT